MIRTPFLSMLLCTVAPQTFGKTLGINRESIQCSDAKIAKDLPFCLPMDYKNDIPPFGINPLNVTIVALFKDIIAVNDDDNNIKFSMEVDMKWVDYRIKSNLNSSSWIEDDIKWVHLNLKWLEYLWKPLIAIQNIVEFKVKKILDNQAFLELFEDNTIWLRAGIDVVLNCPLFDFETYPFDEQVCDLRIGGYDADVTQIIYNGHFSYNKPNQRALQYDVKEVSALPFEDTLFYYQLYYHTKNGGLDFKTLTYSTFAVRITFARLLQPHIICTYLPSFLLVVSSWLGFLIDPDSVPGRVALSVTILLVLMNMR